MHVHDLNVLTNFCSLNGDDNGTVFISLQTANMHKKIQFLCKHCLFTCSATNSFHCTATKQKVIVIYQKVEETFH